MRQLFDARLKPMLLITLIVLLLGTGALAKNRENKFLILHLDAVASVDFFRELEAGHLPNIERIFATGQIVKHGITLYPGGTEIIMPRIKKGLENSEGNMIGWGYLDRETGRKINDIPIFIEMFFGFPRRNRHQFLLGIPMLEHLAGFSLLNIDRLWETQDVVEFYWFHSDVMGHLLGHEAHIKSIFRFDSYLGLAADSGKLNGANLILYCDHGMTAEGVQVVKHNVAIKETLGEELRYLAYPNIYLEDPSKKADLAQNIARDTPIDIAAIKVDQDRVIGYTELGIFEIIRQNHLFQYRFQGEDYFGYEQLGYGGELWSKEKWLQETKDHLYPAVPPNLFGYLSNPHVGDIVAILDVPKIPFAIRAQKGNHAGLKHTDALIPLLVTGPAFADLPHIEEFWLHELYSKHLTMIDFEAKHNRERHSFSVGYPLRAELMLSPAYRWRGGLTISGEGVDPWAEYDLYSSFLTRVWVGTFINEKKLKWQLRVEGFVGNLGVSWLKRADQNGVFNLHWRLTNQVEVSLWKERIGVSILF